MGMQKEIPVEMIRILADTANEYVTAEKLAERLQVSRRTVFNNMKAAREICLLHDSKIISVKSKGYKIKKSAGIRAFLKEEQVKYKHTDNKEYKLYIIYLLLDEEEALHISELEDILYLSRPTIYRLLEEIGDWFEENKMQLIVSRKGISVETGEKRLRAAMKNWLIEVSQLLDGKREDWRDTLKLRQCAEDFFPVDYACVLKVVSDICESIKLVLSGFELGSMCYMLEVILYRVQNGFYVEISERLFDLMKASFSEKKINGIMDEMEVVLNRRLPERETIYFMVLLLNNGDLEDRSLLANPYHTIEINAQLMEECENYLRRHLRIGPEDFRELIRDIEFIIMREVLFQIKGETGRNSRHYNAITRKYNATVIMAQELYQIIAKYYSIEYYEKTICNIAFSILHVLQKNKRNLKAVLVHNCDIFEFKFVWQSLQSFPFIEMVFSADSVGKLNSYLEKNATDVIISTIGYQNETIPTIEISKVFGGNETVERMGVINQLYQRINFEELMRVYDIK
jgi:lichenan operon transcriptional antiterminator